MSRTWYAASKPISVLPFPTTRLLGTWFARQSYNPISLTRPPVRIIPSRKRRRTVAARLRSGVLELLVPASMPLAERQHWAEVMSRRLERRAERHRPSDERLAARAKALNEGYFDGRLSWSSVGFAEMKHQWGSCTYTDGAIRIATRAASLPDWVLDYLLVHELAHLVQSDHGPEFGALEGRYPLTERAKGYLLALDSMATA